MNTYVNIAKHKGPKKKKTLEQIVGRIQTRITFCMVKYSPLLVFALTRKTPYSEKFPAYCFVFKDCITAECLWL